MSVSAVTFLDRIRKIKSSRFREQDRACGNDKGRSQRDRPKRFDPATAGRRNLRFDLFPESARWQAAPPKSAEARVEFFLRLEQTGTLRARFEMLLDFKAVFGVQLRVEIEPDKFPDFRAFHSNDLLLARRIASRIFWRARERFPITLSSGMPRHSLISR